MLRSLKGMLAFAGLILLSSASLGAEAHAKGAVVFLNSVPVLEFKSGAGSAVLASEAAKALRQVDDDAEVKTKAAGADVKIIVGSSPVLAVTPEEASAHSTNAARLAESWAATIRDALSLPPLKFSADFLREPLGTTKLLGFVGSLAASAAITSSNEAVVRVDRSDEGLKVRCLSVGDAQIKAQSGNSYRILNVFVRPFAAALPQQFVAEVTGYPASGPTVAGAVEACVKARTVCLPTATCSFAPVQADSLPPGRSRTYSVYVRLRAPEAFDGVGNVTVTVRNLAIPKLADTALWYSNAPESVHQIGPLFSSFLKRDMPVRFLYHHVDDSSQPMILRVEAINDTDQTAKVMVTPGDSKPDRNPVRAGLVAALEFLKYWSTDSGEVVILPPHSTFPISIRRLSPKETMSGLCGLRLLDGPDQIQVRADALPPFDLQGCWYDASFSSTPWHDAGVHPVNDYDRALSEPSLQVYPNPYKDERIEYTVGGRYGFLLIGQKPISGEDHTNNLDGNFGVIYRIKATIKNPTPASEDVDLVFEASAGYMGGLFFVDGDLVQTPYVGPKTTSRVGRFHLAAGATKTVDIVTVPLSGGSYPATLFLRPVEQVASSHH